MYGYIVKRLLLIIPTLLWVSIIIFLTIRLIPGGVIDQMTSQQIYMSPHEKKIGVEELRHELGLDVPIYVQYGRWIENIIMHGSFGDSLWKKTPVINDIIAKAPITFELTLLAIIVGLLISFPIGIYSAIRQDTVGDYIGRSFAILCIAIPSFWLGTMIMVFPSIWWGWAPEIMLIHFTEDPIGNLQMFIIPSIVLGMGLAGTNMRMMRSMMLEVLRQDYVRTAWSKGLRERTVIMRHVLKNALIPVITTLGLSVPFLIGGTVIIEQIFALPGLGRLVVESTFQRDYPVISGTMLCMGFAVLIINLLVDLTYGFLDPRIQYR